MVDMRKQCSLGKLAILYFDCNASKSYGQYYTAKIGSTRFIHSHVFREQEAAWIYLFEFMRLFERA